MKLRQFVPPGLRRALVPLYYEWITSPLYQKLYPDPTPDISADYRSSYSQKDVQTYWQNPSQVNDPSTYLDGAARSEFLVTLVKKHLRPGQAILELGCNTGRNLHYLHQAGFKPLSAIEINPQALESLRQHYPQTAQAAKLINAPLEDALPKFADGAFDLVFSMAVLQHVHYDSDGIFPHIARIAAQTLVIIEDETRHKGRHFPRDYRAIFGGLGWRQIKAINCGRVQGLDYGYTARVFVRA